MTTNPEHETEYPSGLDMAGTLRWYEENQDQILPLLPAPSSKPKIGYQFVDANTLDLSEEEINGLINLFSESALDRSVLKEIISQPKTWFSTNSTKDKPVPTINSLEAMSKTAVVPGYTDYSKWPDADIWLYQLDDEDIPPEIRKIIISQAFVHELAHTILAPALYKQSSQITLEDGQPPINAQEYLLSIGEAIEKLPPISHYASTYRDDDGKFIGDRKLAINEALAEAITAYLLGFSYREDASGLDPFSDQPEIREMIKAFLEAKPVPQV